MQLTEGPAQARDLDAHNSRIAHSTPRTHGRFPAREARKSFFFIGYLIAMPVPRARSTELAALPHLPYRGKVRRQVHGVE